MELNLPIQEARLAGSMTIVKFDPEAPIETLIPEFEGVHLLVTPSDWLSIKAFIRTSGSVIHVERLQEIIWDGRFEGSALGDRIRKP